MIRLLRRISSGKEGKGKGSLGEENQDKMGGGWGRLSSHRELNHPCFQMSMVSYFFKLSMVLRNVHTTLTEEYQLPYWASYVAFALATIALGRQK